MTLRRNNSFAFLLSLCLPTLGIFRGVREVPSHSLLETRQASFGGRAWSRSVRGTGPPLVSCVDVVKVFTLALETPSADRCAAGDFGCTVIVAHYKPFIDLCWKATRTFQTYCKTDPTFPVSKPMVLAKTLAVDIGACDPPRTRGNPSSSPTFVLERVLRQTPSRDQAGATATLGSTRKRSGSTGSNHPPDFTPSFPITGCPRGKYAKSQVSFRGSLVENCRARLQNAKVGVCSLLTRYQAL